MAMRCTGTDRALRALALAVGLLGPVLLPARGSATPLAHCGDGTCDGGETACLCARDCPAWRERELVERHAPRLVFARRETDFPSSAPGYLARLEAARGVSQGEDSTAPEPRFYVHTRAVAGSLAIQYWFFYPYNRSILFFSHEGDWEHVTVWVSRASGDAWKMYFAQHDGGQPVPWSDVVKASNGQPLVYVARGTHASYPRAGTTRRYWLGVDDHEGGGLVLNTRGRLISLQDEACLPATHWMRFGGRWGNGANSPRSPLYQRAWNAQ